jgi:hypothetical protein
MDSTVMAAARVLADQKQISLGAAVSELALRGLRPAQMARRRGFPTLVPADPARVITDELVERHRDDD